MALFMASVDQTVVATALRAIQTDLGAGLEWTGWTVTIYALGQVLVMPLAGKFSDLYGRKKIFLIRCRPVHPRLARVRPRRQHLPSCRSPRHPGHRWWSLPPVGYRHRRRPLRP